MARALNAAAPATDGIAAGSGTANRIMQYTEQQQYVNGRTFFQNNGQWIDSEVQKQKDAKRVRVQFGSTEYFDLLRKEPETRAWMALGQNIQFVLKGAVYEIYE